MTAARAPQSNHVQSPEEQLLCDALVHRASTLPPYDTLLVAPQTWALVRGRTFRLDLLVIYRGRAVAVEVDDPTHHGRWAADASRDALIRDAGVEPYRVVLEEVLDPLRVEEHVDRILARLGCCP